ncbi:glycolate permease GlcA [Lactobacillus pasteurii DSM 23907 = CRBIP 24.76]|uniref:L-lactate permease n=1 Tax=Lactobacillus pasteurii DSM 23907 = CRBIP 24.76 TaxID=1423790 RepID=I7LBD9_9LACO|nr:L-lactate permease [Lactobacillus pasteurii]KRK07732.1 glycolate permease GlcA [Lactobacillus pasteurii DSM 23907 = CRBIP 24.76]TDG77547.1 hypothetical protein C5L33_000990 [Lactobacillus pasteurii]CCI85491.1 Transporter, lactate permease (LctP) family protein [Lactobacillus pasteurii DSM 23907 = CRBIP 24.76]
MLKFVLALIPIVWLIVSLGVLKMAAPKATTIGLALTIIISIFGFKLSPLDTFSGALEGALMGLFPIIYVIIAALFTYNVTTKSGAMNKIQDMLSAITTDKRILTLIIAWGFGGFLEAIAGFGTAVAIPAGIMISFGVDPIKASVVCLIANTTPTAFGAIGLPVITLGQVTGLNLNHLSVVVTLQLLLLIVLIPFVLVAVVDKGIKSIKGVFLITLMSGLAFALPQIFVAKFVGPELPAIVGSILSIAVTVAIAKTRKADPSAEKIDVPHHSTSELLKACAPFILVFVFVLLASSLVPPINHALNAASIKFPVYTGKGAGLFNLNLLASPGTLIIVATFIGGLIQGLGAGELFGILGKTIAGIWKTAITVCAIVALAKVMGYSQMTASLADTLVKIMGPVYPLVAPIIGALGTFITGSDTSANVLFGGLQLSAAHSLGVNEYWLVANNMVGATAGKMISPQSIAVASAAIGQEGSEGEILKQALKWCALYLVVICVVLFVLGKFI